MIKQLYDVPSLPMHYVAECDDGKYRLVYIVPFRRLTDADLLSVYHDDPRITGRAVPVYVAAAYCLRG